MNFMKETVEPTRFDRSQELVGTMVEKEKDELTKAIENYGKNGGAN